jgi:hypothetical protein
MTDDERKQEGLDEAIEDLEAPAVEQGDVAGGKELCASPTCVARDTSISTFCAAGKTCAGTCTRGTCGQRISS